MYIKNIVHILVTITHGHSVLPSSAFWKRHIYQKLIKMTRSINSQNMMNPILWKRLFSVWHLICKSWNDFNNSQEGVVLGNPDLEHDCFYWLLVITISRPGPWHILYFMTWESFPSCQFVEGPFLSSEKDHFSRLRKPQACENFGGHTSEPSAFTVINDFPWLVP